LGGFNHNGADAAFAADGDPSPILATDFVADPPRGPARGSVFLPSTFEL
jgi:hypothetical protein